MTVPRAAPLPHLRTDCGSDCSFSGTLCFPESASLQAGEGAFCGVVMFVFREEHHKEREKPGDHDGEDMTKWQEELERVHNHAEIIIGNQRH